MTSSWKIANMGELAEDSSRALVIGPFGSDLKTTDFTTAGVPVVFVRNVRPSGFTWCGSERRYVSSQKAKKLAAHRVKGGDLVVTKMGLPPCAAAAYPDGEIDGIVTADIIKLTLDEKKADRRFVAHYLNSPSAKREIARFTFGVTRPKVTLRDFKAMPVPLPPVSVQRRIADILDKADAIRRKRQEAIALTESLLRSAFLEMFGDPVTNPGLSALPPGWRRCQLSDLQADVKWACVGGPFGSNLTSKDYVPEPGVPIIRGSNLSKADCFISEREFVYVSTEKAGDLVQNMAHPGDVVFTQRGTLGQVGMVPRKSRFERYVISQSQMKLTPNENLVDPVWLVSYFQAPIARRTLEQRILATGVPHINLGILRKFPVNLPPVQLQSRFADLRLRQICAQATQTEALTMATDLFDSLVQRAFRGQLTM